LLSSTRFALAMPASERWLARSSSSTSGPNPSLHEHRNARVGAEHLADLEDASLRARRQGFEPSKSSCRGSKRSSAPGAVRASSPGRTWRPRT
jgi:hypothetical protein